MHRTQLIVHPATVNGVSVTQEMSVQQWKAEAEQAFAKIQRAKQYAQSLEEPDRSALLQILRTGA